MSKLMLACCKVYISESRNRVALESIERAAKLFPEAPIVNKFEDVTYNRVGYTLVSSLAPKSSLDQAAGIAKSLAVDVGSSLQGSSPLNLSVICGIFVHDSI